MQKKKYYINNSTTDVEEEEITHTQKQKGITLIALIITIIVMLILVTVTVRMVLNSGLFKHAGVATDGHSMTQVRERLATTLASAYMQKTKDLETFDLDTYIKSEIPEAKISDTIVVIGKWAFQIDRDTFEIINNLGDEGEYIFPKILSVVANVSENKETATLTIEAEETENGINKIEIYLDGEKIDEKDCEHSKTKVTVTTKLLTENGKYKIKVYSKLMATQIKEITELATGTRLEVTSNNSADNTYAEITVTTKEPKKGIQKIEITKEDGSIVVSDECNGNKELINKTYKVEENGTYTITVYAENNVAETVTIAGILANRTGLKIGDYVAYTPDIVENYKGLGTSESEKAGTVINPADGIPQDTTLTWRIMNINNDGSVDIISTAPIQTEVYLKGALGYNNGVLLLNDLCRTQYSNSELGATARSINVDDIEDKFNSIGIGSRDKYNNGVVQYGQTKKYTGNYSYSPDIYDKIGKNIANRSKDYYNKPTTVTHSKKSTLEVKQTYFYCAGTMDAYFDDQDFHELIFGTDKNYWLASRCSACYSQRAEFGLMYVSKFRYGYLALLQSQNANLILGNAHVRPVVSLSPYIKISTEGGTEDNPKTISK